MAAQVSCRLVSPHAHPAQVARLFAGLSASASTACSQVLCVSHNAAFQALCGRVVSLTRGASGTALAGGGSAAAARAQKPRAAAA